MTYVDRNPWKSDTHYPRDRFRSLTPASGWYAVYGWIVSDTDEIEIVWEPVAIKYLPTEEDETNSDG